jgi:hypothetical protein
MFLQMVGGDILQLIPALHTLYITHFLAPESPKSPFLVRFQGIVWKMS